MDRILLFGDIMSRSVPHNLLPHRLSSYNGVLPVSIRKSYKLFAVGQSICCYALAAGHQMTDVEHFGELLSCAVVEPQRNYLPHYPDNVVQGLFCQVPGNRHSFAGSRRIAP